MKKSLVVHPFLFALYPVLFLFAHNIGELPFTSLALPLAIIVSLSFLNWFILTFLLKDGNKSGFIVSLFLLLFFSYGHFDDFLKQIYIIWPILFVVGVYFSLKPKKNIENYTNILNVIAAFLVIISLVPIVLYQFRTRGAHDITTNTATAKKLPDTMDKVAVLPNIFFIILDGYARDDVLKEIYGYDNNEFLTFLSKQGFFIANQSRSNYSQTALTLASSLNMKYVNDLVGSHFDIESDDKLPLWRMIRQSTVTEFLKKKGYTIATFTPEIIDKKTRNAYISLKPGLTLNRFQNALINTTPIPAVLNVLETSNQFDLHRKEILYTVNHLVDLAKQNHPLFVFAHVEAPHPPFVFGPNGEKRNPEEKFDDHDGNWLIRKGRLTREQYLQGYRDQLIYINKKMTTVIEQILAQSKYPPIIIIFGDHGPRSTLVWHNPDNTYMKECMSILNAYYLPNGGNVDLYNDITPVNTFRIILNRYFGMNHEIVADESYFSTAQYCYKFLNVTDRIKNSNNEILHHHLGKSLLDEGDLDKAIHQYSEALRINSSSVDAHINLALIYSKKNQNTKAVFHFNKAIQFKPKNHALHNDLGVAYLKLSQPQQAIPHFKEAIKIKPDFMQAYLNLGDALAQQNRFEEAIDNYKAALQIQPDSADAHNKIGVAYARQGRLEEAIASFSETLRIKPDDVRAQNNLRIALQQAGRAEEAALLETRP